MRNSVLTLFVFAIASISSGCGGKETDCGCGCNEIPVSEKTLYQTRWEGTLRFPESGIPRQCDINILFETESRGRYITTGLAANSEYSARTTLEYNTEGKIISLYGGVSNILLGDWWIEASSGEYLSLKREPDTEYESTLILKKKY